MLTLAANNQPRMSYENCLLFQKEGDQPYDILNLADQPTLHHAMRGIAKFSWGDVMEWMSLQIKYVNLYYFLLNSLYNQVIWN